MKLQKPKKRAPAVYRRLTPYRGFWMYITSYTDEVPEKNLEPVFYGEKWYETLAMNTNIQLYHEFVHRMTNRAPLAIEDVTDFQSANFPGKFAVFRRKFPDAGCSTYFPGYIGSDGSFVDPAQRIITDTSRIVLELGTKTWKQAISKAERLQYLLEEG